MRDLDVIIIGAGLSGIVAAREAAESGKQVLLVEKKNHIGGHCYDYLNEKGIYIHQYGPHIFHTDNKTVWDYLSRFTDWHYYQHRVLGAIDGRKIPIPFNLNSLKALFPQYKVKILEEKLVETFGFNSRVPILKLREVKDPDLKILADFIHEKVFLHYTAKQWGMDPFDVDPSVSERVPIVISRDDRYFANPFQGIPREGYTSLFLKMLNHPSIHLLLNTDAKRLLTTGEEKVFFAGIPFSGVVIYTGPVDELFDYTFGPLAYRSLDIVFENLEQNFYQENSVINYPNDYSFTRITEFKHFQPNTVAIHGTTICREYPQNYHPGKNNPYYIVKNSETIERYHRYYKKAEQIENFHLLGRLGKYGYYDMDKIVEEAILLSSKIFK